MKLVRIPGFHPINWYIWNRKDKWGDTWTDWAGEHRPLWVWRARLLWSHRRLFR